MSRAAARAALLAIVLLVGGCRGGDMTDFRFVKDAESLHSLATEGSMLADGVVAQAARDLGLSRQALYRRMEKLGLKAPVDPGRSPANA